MGEITGSLESECTIGSGSVCRGAPVVVIEAVDAGGVGEITGADLVGEFLSERNEISRNLDRSLACQL